MTVSDFVISCLWIVFLIPFVVFLAFGMTSNFLLELGYLKHFYQTTTNSQLLIYSRLPPVL